MMRTPPLFVDGNVRARLPELRVVRVVSQKTLIQQWMTGSDDRGKEDVGSELCRRCSGKLAGRLIPPGAVRHYGEKCGGRPGEDQIPPLVAVPQWVIWKASVRGFHLRDERGTGGRRCLGRKHTANLLRKAREGSFPLRTGG